MKSIGESSIDVILAVEQYLLRLGSMLNELLRTPQLPLTSDEVFGVFAIEFVVAVALESAN